LLYIGTAVAAVIVVVALAVGAIYQYVILPNEAFASVNGEKITRTDYVKYRKFTLLQQIAQQQQQLQFATAEEQPQIQQALGLAQFELEQLNNGTVEIDPTTLKTLVDNEVVLQGMDEMGITISQEEIDQYMLEILSPISLSDPTQTPTIHPTAAAWATETTEMFMEQATQTTVAMATAAIEQQTVAAATSTAMGTPPATPTEAPPEGTGTTEADGTQTAEPAGTAEAETTGTPAEESTGTAAADGTADPNQTPAVSPTATISRDDAIATSQAGFELLDQNFLDQVGMSREDFERLVAEPGLARIKVRDALAANIPDVAEQVLVSHILVATEEAANELINGRLQTEDFAVVAEEVSMDTGSAVDGGSLGWNPRGIFAQPFEDAAFSQPIGEISQQPVQTEFGWHIILVLDKEENRPVALSTLQQQRSGAVSLWIQERREAADISSDVELPADNAAPGVVGT
jgi:parvulin-like peptidyl-prolyl isomerase